MRYIVQLILAVVTCCLAISSPVVVFAQVDRSVVDVKISQPFGNVTEDTFGRTDPAYWLSTYVAEVFRYGVALAALLAVIMIMVGGFIWITAGSSDRVKLAKEYILSALLGLVLALSAVVLLGIINPRLVELQPIEVRTIDSTGSTGNSDEDFPSVD